ncbi:MAG: ABC transporter permease, partial [Pseudomonadota bacterium]|nr:ABC transporter permease [Pseudomonadota bacterium]
MAEQFEQALTGAATDVAQFEEAPPSLLKRVQHFLHANPTAIPLIILMLGLVAFSLLVGRKFFHPFNLSLIVSQTMLIGFLGAAQTLIVLTAGIDLSVGTIMILASVVMGKLAVLLGVPAPLALILGILAGVVCGAINGSLVVY